MPPGGALAIELTRVIKAPRPRVFDAWIRPATIRQWFAPEKMVTTAAETDPVVGGAYAISMQGTLEDAKAERPSQSKNHVSSVSGTYTKISPYDIIQFTWAPNWAPAEISRVTLHFRDVEGGTELKLVHDQIASDSSCQGYTQGWTGCLNKLETFMSA
jgi:glutathione S-transferase